MKLRLRGDSLRLRLTQTEVQTLLDQGVWQDATALGAAVGLQLAYRVESAAEGGPAVIYATGSEGTVVIVRLPATEVATWASTPQVGIYFNEPWGLKIAIEKDFRCLDPSRDEDESDNYTNPNEGQGHAHLDTCDAD